MQNTNEMFTLSKKNKMSLEDEYIKKRKDKELSSYLDSIRTTEKILMRYTSRLEESFNEKKNCSTCKCLEECKNKNRGYVFTPYASEKSITFSYDACNYLVDYNKKTAYQKNVTLFETPKSLKEASLHNIYTDDKNRTAIIKYFKEFITSYDNDRKDGIYLYGSFGSGKTYLIAALFNEFAKKNVNSVILYFPEFLRSLKESFQTDYKDKFYTVKHASLLLIDDIGAENLTQWSRDEVLGPILEYRMEEHLPTFFTSNLSLKDLEEHLKLSSSAEETINARRIIERIKKLTTEMNLISKNRRG